MANLSKIRREKMLKYLEKLKAINNDDEHIRAITEIENALNEKKYGLVWEEHSEKVDEILEHSIPIFVDDEARKITKNENEAYNFLLEGDNLHSLKLLEKTHRGEIDVIYIDPPYNTGNKDFIYDDSFVDKTDGYAHSKWISFMEKRIRISKRLMSDNGVIFISIDDNEQAQLKLLCDSVFGESNFESFIWKKKGGAGNTEKIVGCLTEYILCYFKKKKPGIIKYRNIDRVYKYEDEIGKYNLEGIEKTNLGTYYRPTMVFDIIDKKTGKHFTPGKDKRWTIGQQTVNDLQEIGKLFFDYKKNKVFRIKREDDYESAKNVYYNLLIDLGSLSVAKDEMKEIIGNRELFDTPKPIELIKHLVKISSKTNSIILDFFAGSGTTGHAVMQLNKEDGGNRKYILCTNNENNICEEVTYQRLKNIQNELPHNLKYFKTDFIPKFTDEEDSVLDKIMDHIRELIELEHALEIDGKKYIIISDEDKLDEVISKIKNCGKLFIKSGIFLTRNHQRLLEEKDVSIIEIPEYYFREELKEIGEL